MLRVGFWMALFCVLSAVAQAAELEVRGRVVDANGLAVEGAVVSVKAVSRVTGTRYGRNEDVDAETRSGRAGDFVIRGRNPFLSVTVTVEKDGFAKGVFSQLGTGEGAHELKLLEGASVTGVLRKNGEPVRGVKLGLSDFERGSEIYHLNLTAETDGEGRFRFVNVPPRRTYFLFGRMESLREAGVLAARKIEVGLNESVFDAGVLSLEKGLVLEGIALPKARVLLGRDGPRDTQEVVCEANGRFRFAGVPAEVVSVLAEAPGKRLAARNGSLFPPWPNQLLGRMFTNKTDLVFGFEDGETLPPLNVNPYQLREEALRGMEASTGFPGAWEIAGKVSGPSRFTVTEGRKVSESIEWFHNRVSEGSNGVFKIYAAARKFPAALLIEAEVYAPATIVAVGSTNLSVTMQKGFHPHGVVLRPDGKPAVGARVYLTDANAAIQLEGAKFEPIPFHNAATRQARTDGEGKFSFAAREGDSALVVIDESGFAETTVERLQVNREEKLQPWARVEGSLVIAGAPGTNEVIRLITMPSPYSWYPRELPAYSISLRTRADANGVFVFERVPPVMMEIAHSPVISDKAPEPIEKTLNQRLLLKPGETRRVELGRGGRAVIGKVVIEGYEGPISWNVPAIALELIDPNVPNEGPLTNMLARLAAKDEEGYQRFRKGYAEANQNYYGTEKGIGQLLASRRYLVQFGEGGGFLVNDVPPGKYRVRWVLMNKVRLVADFESVIEVTAGPPGSPMEPQDLGIVKIPKRP